MTKKMPVLIINSYAGSLHIAARQESHPVVGSYEDAGYGLEVQRANLPDCDYRPTRADWPGQDLRRTLVIAHPPCAAFSAQSGSAGAHCRGIDAAKFQETKAVLEYAMTNRCAALAVESVPGALEGARAIHDRFAETHGYVVHRLVQCASSFVPQRRPRAWFVFLPRGRHKDLLVAPLPAGPAPTLRSVLGADGPVYPWIARGMERQKRRLKEFIGGRVANEIMHGDHGEGILAAVVRRVLLCSQSREEVGDLHEVARACSEYATFLSQSPRIVLSDGQASALIRTAWWVCEGRALTAGEYQRVMGFPDDYDVLGPGRLSNHIAYLSRGVVPAVARWVLRSLQATAAGERVGEGWLRCAPGATLDVRPGRIATA